MWYCIYLMFYLNENKHAMTKIPSHPTITLYGELYSKKNSKRIIRNRNTGKSMIISSQAYQDSELDFLYQLENDVNKTNWELMLKANQDIYGNQYPLHLNFKIYRQTKRSFDYNNIIQGLQDLMVKAEYLPDDNANYLIPSFTPYEVDKHNPRVILSIDGLCK
jgi:Holliday junction resolvase RusA-like endonuclease